MHIGAFDLNLLKAFDALYAERHVTRAGLRIGLSQSAMSGTLNRLRELLEDELFVRTPSGMQPTPRADDLAGPVSDALRLVRSVLHSDGFDPATADHAFTIAMTDYAAFVLLPPLLARFGVEAPGIDVCVRGMFARSDAVELLDSGEANLAIGFPVEVSARILMRPLLEEGFACIARRGHPAFADLDSLKAFAAGPHLLVSPEDDRAGLVDHGLAALGDRTRGERGRRRRGPRRGMAARRGTPDALGLRRRDRLRSGDLRRKGGTQAWLASVPALDCRRAALLRRAYPLHLLAPWLLSQRAVGSLNAIRCGRGRDAAHGRRLSPVLDVDRPPGTGRAV